MKELHKKAFAGLLYLFVTLSVLLFLPAWTLAYWQAWVFLAVFFASILAITFYLFKYDPKLLERRGLGGPRAEKRKSQKIIQYLMSIAFAVMFIFSALDHRFAWSTVPQAAVAAGDFLVALGLLAIFFVFKENSFASAIIDVAPEQKVVTTGPYALVRHPMYAGALVMILGVPPALGSWWGLLTIVPFALGIVWRLRDEEQLLAKDLPGYAEYRQKVKYRLLPFVW